MTQKWKSSVVVVAWISFKHKTQSVFCVIKHVNSLSVLTNTWATTEQRVHSKMTLCYWSWMFITASALLNPPHEMRRFSPPSWFVYVFDTLQWLEGSFPLLHLMRKINKHSSYLRGWQTTTACALSWFRCGLERVCWRRSRTSDLHGNVWNSEKQHLFPNRAILLFMLILHPSLRTVSASL